MLRRVRKRACRNRRNPSSPRPPGCSCFTSSTQPSSSSKRTSVWGKSPHCSRIAWGIVTWPLLVMRMVTEAGGAKGQ